MFRKGNFPGKYKQYTEYIKHIKDKVVIDSKIIQKHGFNCSQKVMKDFVNSNHVVKYKQVLTQVQDKLEEFRKREPSENTRIIKNNLKKHFPVRLASFAALGVFKSGSDSITVTGYNETDSKILKMLDALKTNVVNSNVASTNTTNDSVDFNLSSVTPSNIIDAELTTASTQTDEIASLFNSKIEYQYNSIFDNMPPDYARNDLYSNICKMFSDTQNAETVEGLGASSGVVDDIATDNTVLSDSNTNQVIESVSDINATNMTEVLDDKIEGGGYREEFVNSDLFNASSNTLETKIVEDAGPAPSEVVDAIPEPPPIPDAAAELASQLNALGEPTLASLGLGGWTPVGMVQQALEFFHISGMPWWGAIALGTVIIRTLMFPLVIISQRNAAKMNNHLPQMQVLQLKMTEARQSGNTLETAQYSHEFMTFMKEKKLNPLKNMIVPLAQMPVFVSIFMGLRQMANTPVASLQTGGMFWFTDLTVPDQFFVLPIITSLTLLATIELGADGAKLSSQNMQTMRYVLRVMPLAILPFTINFPGAILCYWVSTNFVSLIQVGILKIPSIRRYCKIDALVKHENLPVQPKSFVGGIKDSWTNIKISKELEERRRLDQLQFQRAGKGPLVKTYKFDPTKVAKTVSAKNS